VPSWICFSAILRLATDAQALGYRLIDQLFLGRFRIDHLEGFAGNSAVDLFELEIAFEASPSNRSLLDFVRGVTEGEALIVEVAVLPQARNHLLHHFLIRTLAAQQTLAQLCDGPRFRGE
jgi:hypothetical protein